MKLLKLLPETFTQHVYRRSETCNKVNCSVTISRDRCKTYSYPHILTSKQMCVLKTLHTSPPPDSQSSLRSMNLCSCELQLIGSKHVHQQLLQCLRIENILVSSLPQAVRGLAQHWQRKISAEDDVIERISVHWVALIQTIVQNEP